MGDERPKFTLYRRERWKFGDPAAEEAEFLDHSKRVAKVQVYLAGKSGGLRRRVFHAKSHGCLLGQLKLSPKRPATTQHGIFGPDAPEAYTVLARFSNGLGTIESDWKPDVCGVALKLFGTMPQQPHRSVDFLMTNSPAAFGADHAEFIEFMEASKDGPLSLALLSFLPRHLRAAWSLRTTLVPRASLAELKYWSGHAYLLGADCAMKMNLRPQKEPRGLLHSLTSLIPRIDKDPNFLSQELAERAALKGLRFTFSLQLESKTAPDSTSVEDALREWTERSSPSVPVGELEFPPQRVTEAQKEYVERLPFNPWNYHPEHRPLGNLARGRLYSYAASREGRSAQAAPTHDEFIAEWNARA